MQNGRPSDLTPWTLTLQYSEETGQFTELIKNSIRNLKIADQIQHQLNIRPLMFLCQKFRFRDNERNFEESTVGVEL